MTAKPVLRPKLSATIPKAQGPKQQPVSPHIANTLYITDEPSGNSSAPAEYIPGQEILTVKPQIAQNISETHGILQTATTT